MQHNHKKYHYFFLFFLPIFLLLFFSLQTIHADEINEELLESAEANTDLLVFPDSDIIDDIPSSDLEQKTDIQPETESSLNIINKGDGMMLLDENMIITDSTGNTTEADVIEIISEDTATTDVLDNVVSDNAIENTEHDDIDFSAEDSIYPIIYEGEEDDLSIVITQEIYDTSTCYVAHISTDGTNPFDTEYAYGQWGVYNDQGSGYIYGETATEAADRLDCTFLVNGDFRDVSVGSSFGIVRNGEVVNDKGTPSVAVGLTNSGDFVYVGESVDPNDLINIGVSDTFSFGPTLVYNGEITNNGDYSNWNTAKANPRTLVGQVYHEYDPEDPLYGTKEYYVVVVDGRQPGYSDGLTLLQCATFMQYLGCDFAYNLDGGGSSAMVYQGNLLNSPSGGSERRDCDFIYIQ